MKVVILGEKINGITKVEEVKHNVVGDYSPPKYVQTNAEDITLTPITGKMVYLGYDEENDKFVPIYEDRPLTEQERLELLELALEDLILSGGDL